MKNAEFLSILENGDKAAIIPFLKSLTIVERRKLVPDLRNESKKYDNWEIRRKPEVQGIIYVLRVARFVCSTASEVKNFRWWEMPEIETIEEILEWYQPEWFSDYTNNAEVFHDLDYKRLLYWQHRGWVNPSAELIVSKLPEAIKQKNAEDNRFYTTEVLEQYPVTLEEHIWYLFYYPSNIAWEDVENTKFFAGPAACWSTTFKRYIDEGRLDRMSVLRESLLAVNRNFNKIQTGWYTTLFLFLEPTPDELFEIHEELFATLTCVQTKPVNATLTLFKKMAKDKRFPVADFVQHLPAMLSAEGKSIVTSTLAVVEILMKQKAGDAEELCSAVCTAFLSKDEAVQKKAATIITRYAQPESSITEVLNSFADNILMSVKPLLQAYLIENQTETESTGMAASDEDLPSGFLPLIREDNRITTPETFEDFAFSLSTLLDVGEAHYFDLLLDGIAFWGSRTDEESLILLEAVFQKAYNNVLKIRERALSDMPLLAVIHYCDYLQKKFPGKLENIAKIKRKAEDFDKQRDETGNYYRRRIIPFEQLKVYDHLTGFKSIAVAAVQKMQQTNPLPLLSTPTHLPAWIDPAVLVNKLVQYQQRGEAPDDMDLQLALQRCALRATEEALVLAREQLTGELRSLILFLFGEHRLPQGDFVHPAWWMTAGITRSPGTRFKEFESFPYNKNLVTYHSDNIGWETYLEYDQEYNRYHPALKLNMPEYKLRESNKAKDNDYLFLEYTMCLEYMSEVDLILSAMPNTPDAFYAYTIDRVSGWGTLEVAEQQLSLLTIKKMRELDTPLREMHYLLLVMCLLASQKPSRDYALDTWTSRVSAGTIDNTRLGKTIGKYVYFELAPLKRFTDLLALSVIGFSARHNRAALEVVEGILSELNPEPIKNLKKLLEIYKELLALNSAKADFDGIPQLSIWQNEKSLKKLVKQIAKI